MTQEEKQLLLKDIFARLPYGVKGLHRGQVHELFTIDGREANNACIQVDGYDAWFSVDTFKPYLRPMSSMTEEELHEYNMHLFGITIGVDAMNFMIWIYQHHLDILHFIEKGFALEAPEGMYS